MEKNKIKVFGFLILAIFLVAIITGQVLEQRRESTLGLNQSVRTSLATRGIIDPTINDKGCDDNYCYFEINQDLSRNVTLKDSSIVWKSETYHLGEQKIPRKKCTQLEYDENQTIIGCLTFTDSTREELELIQDEVMRDVSKRLAVNFDEKDSRVKQPRIKVLDDGDINLGNIRR